MAAPGAPSASGGLPNPLPPPPADAGNNDDAIVQALGGLSLGLRGDASGPPEPPPIALELLDLPPEMLSLIANMLPRGR